MRLDDGIQVWFGDKELHELVVDTGDCWVWKGQLSERASRALYNGRPVARYMFEQVYGPLASITLALHLCDHPWCVRPAHLYTGTKQDNYLDCVQPFAKRFARFLAAAWTPVVSKIKEVKQLRIVQPKPVYPARPWFLSNRVAAVVSKPTTVRVKTYRARTRYIRRRYPHRVIRLDISELYDVA